MYVLGGGLQARGEALVSNKRLNINSKVKSQHPSLLGKPIKAMAKQSKLFILKKGNKKFNFECKELHVNQ